MKWFTIIMCYLAVFSLPAQATKATQTVPVKNEKYLDLDFAFADLIKFEIWDKSEVLVEVMVQIDNGAHNDIFTLSAEAQEDRIQVVMDREMWKKLENQSWHSKDCSYSTEINYTIHLPKQLVVQSETISGNYELTYFGKEVQLKTISGEIDLVVPESLGLDFKASTITGEMYSDLEISYPEGKDGLRQIVGQRVVGQVNGGGSLSLFDTISGNIYLRKE